MQKRGDRYTLKSVLLMHSKTSAGVLDCTATVAGEKGGGGQRVEISQIKIINNNKD